MPARKAREPKRANGQGTIYLRADGRWTGAVSLPRGRRKQVYGKSPEDVRRQVAAIRRSLENGEVAAATGVTVGQFLDQWLAQVVRPNVRSWTYAGYEVHVRLHLKPTVGKIVLDKLSPMDVQHLLNRKLSEGMKPKSVRYIRGTLRTALNQAIRWGLINRNSAALVDGPRVPQYEIQPFTPEEARTFLLSLRGDRLEALYSVALTMGLRQGEALGLRWQDVDLDLGYIRISRQLQRIDGKYELAEPKTARSRRTLAMPPTIVRSLHEHRRRQLNEQHQAGDRWIDNGLVFTTALGKPLDGTGISKRFHQYLDRAGLAQRRFHDLRHSCATLLMVQGVSPRVVMEVLGHSQISLTMNTYSHVIPELKRQAADRMEDLLNQP